MTDTPSSILAEFEAYLDAYREAVIADEQAGPHADTDPDVDRAWERVNELGTAFRRRISDNAELAVALRSEAAAFVSACQASDGIFDDAETTMIQVRVGKDFFDAMRWRAPVPPVDAERGTNESA